MGDKAPQLAWDQLYNETKLYKATLKTYTKSIFRWSSALVTSHDDKTLYEFAKRGTRNIESIHKKLSQKNFVFRPGKKLSYNFNGKLRDIYIYPWEERIVDTLLYNLINDELHNYFSENSYAYRQKKYSLDSCQKKLGKILKQDCPLYILKRDIRNYFNSVNHEILLNKLKRIFQKDDYLFSLLKKRVEFEYVENKDSTVKKSNQGIPFGCAISCVLANLYLHDFDKKIEKFKPLGYFRYADDFIIVTTSFKKAQMFNDFILSETEILKLDLKESHNQNLFFTNKNGYIPSKGFKTVKSFKHLGLEFRANKTHGLSKEKMRKIRNQFRYALKRKIKQIDKQNTTEAKLKYVIKIINDTLDKNLKRVAIIDYYLKHIEDENQLKELDHWLAQEVLFRIFKNGHKKGNFKKLSFKKLRKAGLISLRHRANLLKHKKIDSSFFKWKEYQLGKKFRNRERLPS